MTTTNVTEHLRRFWPSNRIESFRWTRGPIEKSLPDFRVQRVEPLLAKDPWLYFSDGAATIDPKDDEPRSEFFIMSPAETPRHVETLAMVANFHADPKRRLHIGKTIRIGWPWMEGATCDHLLVSLPYSYGPDLEWCRTTASEPTRFLWLMPISSSEAAFAATKGAERLEQRLDAAAIDALDVTRPSVV